MISENQNRENDLTPQFPLHALIVEDNPDDAELCLRTLRKARFEVSYTIVDNSSDFVAQLRAEHFDVIISDYNLGPWTGLDALELLQRTGYDIPFILVTGALGESKAVECFKFGIADYVLKDRLDRLPVAIYRALDEVALRHEKRHAERQLKTSETMFRALANAIPTAVFIEQGTQCRYANRAAEELTGYSHTELLEKNFWELILPSSRKAMLRHSPRTVDDLEPSTRYQARILTKHGDVRLLDVTVGTFRLEGGLAALISATDVTPKHPVREKDEVEMPSRFRSPHIDEASAAASVTVARPN